MLLLGAICANPEPAFAAADEAPATARASAAPARLIDAIETSRLVVVGRVGQVRKLDLHGYAAAVWAEEIPGPSGDSIEPGTPIHIAWEELSRRRPARFADQDRVLVCVETLPTASLWRNRFTDPKRRRQTYAVALEGECFVHAPAKQTLEVLDRYLRLSAVERTQAAGIGALLELAERGERTLALGAVVRLARANGLDAHLESEGAKRLVGALLREDADGDLGDALVKLFAVRGGEQLSDALERELRSTRKNDTLPPPRLFDALGAIEGSLPAAEQRRLLEGDAPHRVVAVRYAGHENDATLLKRLAVDDPAPAVRAAAIKRLLATAGDSALPVALDALEDPEPQVRNGAARAIASRPAGIPRLRELIFRDPAERPGGAASQEHATRARQAALGGLGTAGGAGRKVLLEIARDHPDQSLRRLATMALGYSPTHH